MTVLADGGALADWSVLINACIAIGTVGAAVIALRLGLQAQRTSSSQAREARLKLTRQIVTLYRPWAGRSSASVEIVNASPEVITEVQIHVTVPNPNEGVFGPEWRWADTSLGQRFPMISYMLPGTSHLLPGFFLRAVDLESDTTQSDRDQIAVEPTDVQVSVYWRDSYGDVWGRQSSNDGPYPSSWARPWRDLRDVVPKYSQPWYWPPIEQRYPRPLRARVSYRWIIVRARLSRLKKHRSRLSK